MRNHWTAREFRAGRIGEPYGVWTTLRQRRRQKAGCGKDKMKGRQN